MSAKRWTSHDEQLLIQMFKNGDSFGKIANELNRSESAVKMRIESIVYNAISSGKNIDDVAKKLKTSSENIAQMYIVHKNFKMSKGENVKDINVLGHSKQNDKYSTIKIDQLENENRILEAIVKNYELKKQIARIRKNDLDKSITKSLNK